MTISILITNYNGLQLLQQNLPRVLKECQKAGDLCKEIIIVDDASTDGSSSWLSHFAKRHRGAPAISILEQKKNQGFAAAINYGVTHATGDVVLLLNSDVYPNSGFIKAALPHFTNQAIFAVGCMDKSVEKTGVVLRGRGEMYWKEGMVLHRRGEVDNTSTDWVSGGSGFFRRDLFLKLGGFDTLFSPYYWEDIDLSYRARKAGYTLVFEQNSVVVHEHEKGSIKQVADESQIRIVSYRNQLLFLWKNVTDKKLLIAHIVWLPIHIVRSVTGGDWAFISGFIQAIFLYGQVQKKREQNRSLFTVPDRELLEV